MPLGLRPRDTSDDVPRCRVVLSSIMGVMKLHLYPPCPEMSDLDLLPLLPHQVKHLKVDESCSLDAEQTKKVFSLNKGHFRAIIWG